ncbi:branched-chain amino acid ABC transporter permease [Bradyrhizobium erythrophlei]|uniref:branched-chain amino acid ABC transporter permease n=1 Tax=Bradyrhizobium erythrophlei TaxID=1437360 RepID=UPI0035EAEAD8
MTSQAFMAQLTIGLISGCFYAMLSLGLAIIFGLLNIINFAHGAQFMMAAFLTWIGLTQLGPWLGRPDLQVGFWWALLLAPFLVGLVGMAIERVFLRRLYHLDHLYGLLLTFGFALVMEGLFRYGFGVSGQGYEPPEVLQGPVDLGFMLLPKYRVFVVVASLLVCLGTWYLFLQGIPRGTLLGLVDLSSDTAMYYLTTALFAAGFLLVYRIIHSPFGQVLQAVRDNEPRTTSLGYDTDRFRLLAFVLSASIAGYAGAMKALVFQLVSLNDVSLHTSTEAVLMTLLGGVGTIFGPLLGAALVVGLNNYLATIGDLVTVVIGLIFILCVSFFRRGVVGEWLEFRRRAAPEQAGDARSAVAVTKPA